MKDENIRELLSKDLGPKKAPTDEWAKLERSMQKGNKKSFPLLSALTTLLVIVVIGVNSTKSINYDELDEFYVVDSYFDIVDEDSDII